tara:strand:+ start:3866 stop:4330 length:465 start_codon:yes stop_codon:yes gene_type:complete
MVKITLKPSEMAVCRIIGSMRSLVARGNNIKDIKVGKQDGSLADIQGFIAEYAFAKKYNCFFDLGLEPRSGSADGTINGDRYDIKSTTYQSGKLLASLKVNPDVDRYVLAIVDKNTVSLIGWAYKTELINEENLRDLGHGKGYCLEQTQLHQFK